MSWSAQMQAVCKEIESSYAARQGAHRNRKKSFAEFMAALHLAQGERMRALRAMLGESRRQGRQRFNALMEVCKAKRRERRDLLAALFRSCRASLAAWRRDLDEGREGWRAMESRIAAGLRAPRQELSPAFVKSWSSTGQVETRATTRPSSKQAEQHGESHR